MADYDSQLPIRSEADGTDERVHVKLVDYTDPDGTDKQQEVSEKLAHVRMFAEDHGGTKVQLELSEEGKANADGEYNVTTNSEPNSSGHIAHQRQAAKDETHQTKRVSAVDGDSNKTALDVAISDSSGNNIGEDNPLAVYMAESPSDEISSYSEGVDIAKDANSNHDYTVSAAKSLKSIKAFGSASGKARFELQVETAAAAGTFNTVMVKFNSTANPNVHFEYRKAVATGVIVRMVRTNLDNQAQSLYSQIEGLEI